MLGDCREAFSIPSLDSDLRFCFLLSPSMEDDLCIHDIVCLSHHVIPPIKSPDSNAAGRMGLKKTMRVLRLHQANSA
jgi:hypothetical protein